jgi:hypothetical protein
MKPTGHRTTASIQKVRQVWKPLPSISLNSPWGMVSNGPEIVLVALGMVLVARGVVLAFLKWFW